MNPNTRPPSLIRVDQQTTTTDLKKVVIGPNDPRTADCELPAVHVQRSDDVVQTIEVTCRCGEKIVLECRYQ